MRSPMLKIIPAFMALVLLGAGCAIGGQKKPAAPTGGMYYSPDSGKTWKQMSVVLTSQGIARNNQVDVVAATFDPEDSQAMYMGTAADGLFYSYDGGASWMKPKEQSLRSGLVSAVAVHPQKKCTIYAAVTNQLMMSEDCNRSYTRASFRLETGDTIRALIIDWYNPSVVYAAATNGTLFKSTDDGATWSARQRFTGNIGAIAMDPKDSRVLLVGLEKGAMWKTTDGGETWTNLKTQMKEMGVTRVREIVADPTTEGRYVVATRSTIIETLDRGETWRQIPLLTGAGESQIHSLAIDPKNSEILYYGTEKGFYRTEDGGASWTSIQLPTKRAAGTILVQPENTKEIYIGAFTVAKKN